MDFDKRDYRRKSDTYSHKEYLRSKSNHRDGNLYRYRRLDRDYYDDSKSSGRYRYSRISDRNSSSDYHKSSRRYDYSSRNNRYDDRSSRRDDKYCRSSRYEESRVGNHYSNRRTPERGGNEKYSSSRKESPLGDDASSRLSIKERVSLIFPNIRVDGRESSKTLYSIVLENLNQKCSCVDLMQYSLINVGMPDVADILGNGTGIIGYHDRNKFDEIKVLLEKENKIPLINGGFSTLTVGKEQS